ncbi:MAG: TonB-dependent receptor [Sphingomonas sp.]|nr:MAG: TonB-dependent receptor [Sphingomonas sp.]
MLDMDGANAVPPASSSRGSRVVADRRLVLRSTRMDIVLDKRAVKQIRLSAQDAVEEGDTESLREDILEAFSYGAQYDLPATIGDLRGSVYVGYDGSYRSGFSSNPSASAYTNIDGYALGNVRLGFKADDGLNVFGWLRNAFDKKYFELLALQSGSTGLVVGQPGDPRTYGVTVSKSF